MYTIHNTVKISDLRKHTVEVMEEVEKHDGPVMIFSRSKPKAVIMNFVWYQKIQNNGSLTPDYKEKTGLDFFSDPPDEFLLKQKGLDAVKLIRAERD